MPHSIRDYFLNSDNHARGNPHIRNSNAPPSALGLPHTSSSSGTSNTTYPTGSSPPPSYPYTYRFLHRPVQQPPVSSSPSIPAAAITSAASMSQPASVPRMPQYRPLQNERHTSTAAGASTSSNNNSSSGSIGYSSTFYGGGNIDRYSSSNSGQSASSGTHSKTVCRMDCRYCSAIVCLRGMKAMLLADTSVELYSTDHPPGSVQLIDKDYTTSNCKCKIRDVACRVCGNVVGYHITQPCQQCLKAPNNGHFWMFHTEGVIGQERLSLDLGKLVQKLVSYPHAARPPHAVTIAATSPVGGSAENRSRSESATTRLASISRIQHQQRQLHQQQSQVLAASPSPDTSTPPIRPPSSARPSTAEAVIASTASASPSTTATDDEPDVPASSATATLATLSVTQFLQPLKWEQLPPPDVDIDLDPASIGGEPLFADQWVDLVMKTAQAAAVNMCFALDQEEKTERFLERLVENGQLELEDVAINEESVETPERSLDGEPILQATRQRESATIEQLINQVDEFGLSTPSAPSIAEDLKEDEHQDLDANSDPADHSHASGGLEGLQRNTRSEAVPAPGLQGPASSSSASEAILPALFSGSIRVPEREVHRSGSMQSASLSPEQSALESCVSCPVFARTSVMAAQATASAAASDAASAANSLLYSRRGRRDYETMCR